MMQATKHLNSKKGDEIWYYLCFTDSPDSQWALDRFRISGDTSNIKVGVIMEATGTEGSTVWVPYKGLQLTGYTPDQIQPFHKGGGWTTNPQEHDFTFNLSALSISDGAAGILITGLKPENKIWQVYMVPTGYSATRNKNTGIYIWDFVAANVQPNGSEIGRLRMDNLAVLSLQEFFDSTGNYPLSAQEIVATYDNSFNVERLFKSVVTGNLSNGTFTYVARPHWGASERPLFKTNYDILVSRGWSMNGPIPLENTTPVAPTNLSGSWDGNYIRLNWSGASDINYGNYQYKESGSTEWITYYPGNVANTRTNYAVGALSLLSSGKTYNVRIECFGYNDSVVLSNQITITT